MITRSPPELVEKAFHSTVEPYDLPAQNLPISLLYHIFCDRGSEFEEATFAQEYGSELCLVKLGCWGPVVKCNIATNRYDFDGFLRRRLSIKVRWPSE